MMIASFSLSMCQRPCLCARMVYATHVYHVHIQPLAIHVLTYVVADWFLFFHFLCITTPKKTTAITIPSAKHIVDAIVISTG